LETAAEKETEPDVLLGELEKIVSAILGGKDDEDSDETTAADALAAMLNIPPEEIESLEAADSETKAEAVGNAAEALKAPMEAIRQEAPEKVPEAEKLYSEFAAEVVSETEEVPETPVRAGFSALKINNASEQVNNIGRRTYAETEDITPEQTVEAKVPEAEADLVLTKEEKSEEKAGDDRADEIAALGAETESVFVRGDIRTEKVETELKPETARSVEAQVKEVVTDEISEFGDKDGVKELVLILRPKELGQIAVKLVKEANTVSVIMSAQYGEVGKLMSQRAAYLSESLSDSNYEVKDVQIVEPGNAAEQMGLNFTDHGFSFARNSANSDGSENGRGRRGENDGYGEIDGIDEIAADHGEIRLR
ncbi:MAG: flagellar hook-length control protein FliK, partial [Oscillospiraceae bacterium]|nr:flagellar hook-length control protein FliK [Oscillospiraceae bacterium]